MMPYGKQSRLISEMRTHTLVLIIAFFTILLIGFVPGKDIEIFSLFEIYSGVD